MLPSTLLDKAITNVLFRHHTDVKHTLSKFKLKYYHQQERSMIYKHICNCDVSRILKGRVDVPIKIQNVQIDKQQFETVAIHFFGPLRYILSCVDFFSRFAVLNTLPNRNLETVISCLLNVFDKFGYPNTLLSDNP